MVPANVDGRVMPSQIGIIEHVIVYNVQCGPIPLPRPIGRIAVAASTASHC